MYSRRGEGHGDGYVIYRSNLPPRYAGSRFASEGESECEPSGGDCREDVILCEMCENSDDVSRAESECDRECSGESEQREEKGAFRAKRGRFRGKALKISPQSCGCEEKEEICECDIKKRPSFPFSKLGSEELLLGILILLLSGEKGNSGRDEIMVILALLLALR